MSLLPNDTYGWGAVETAKNYGRIGISANVSCTDTDAVATVTLEVWFWSKYSASDSNNNLCFDINTTTASTYVGKADIKTTHNSGSGWNAANKVHIYTYSFTVARETSDKTLYCAAKLTGVEIASGTMTHWISYVVPAIKSYAITYHSNGAPLAGNMPANQIKWYGLTTYLAQPPQLADGYTAKYWLRGGTVEPQYGFGQPYYDNAPIDLYLSWIENTYSITFNANGGTPGSETYAEKKHTQNLQISAEVEPKRDDYNFLGWSADPNATAATWKTDDNYTANAAITLYAVWELAHIPPIISNVVVERCGAEGIHADDGTHFDVSFDWITDEARNAMGRAVYIKAYSPDGTLVVEQTFNISDFASFNGHFSLNDFSIATLGGGSIDSEYNYTVTITVMDDSDRASSVQRTLVSVAYPIDIYKEGKGIAFGKPASEPGVMDVNFKAKFNKELEFVAEAKRSLLDFFYPVNTIYISYSEDYPGDLFGGTWERIQDRFLFGTSQFGVYKIGDLDGESQHYLTIDELPSHQHTLANDNSTGPTYDWTPSSVQTGPANGWTWNTNTHPVGGDQPHNNMPPFVAVAIWRRTA